MTSAGKMIGKVKKMTVTLDKRTEETVRIYFEQSQQPYIKAVLPQKAKTVEEALDDFRKTLLPSATSYGRIIRADGVYLGDVWAYCIDRKNDPNAMLGFCVFDGTSRNKGIATAAVALFLAELREKYGLRTVGAFTFSDNFASRRVLEKNGFLPVEVFVEDGRESGYYQFSF